MGLVIVVGLVFAALTAFGYLASTYPVSSRDLIEGSLVGGHGTSAPLWPVAGTPPK